MTQNRSDLNGVRTNCPYSKKIIDAHLHLPVNYGSFAEKKGALLAQIKENGISAGVVIADSELVSEIGSTEDCVRLFENCPSISVVGGISPLINYTEQLQRLEWHLQRKEIIGIKIYCGHEPVFLNCRELEPVFSLAAQYHVPVLFHSGWDNPQYSAPQIVRSAAKAAPVVDLVYCHCYYPNVSECFDTLAGCENVFFDMSSIADDKAVRSQIKADLEQAIHTMPNRFLFGSDFGSCDQKEHLKFALELDLSEMEKEKLFFQNASKLYQIQDT